MEQQPLAEVSKRGFIACESSDGIATITLNRADKANAQTLEMLDDLDEAWRRAALMENPDQLELLKQQPELAKRATEEVVRWSSPVNYMRRRVLADVEIRGQKIRAGDDLALFYASANRDEDVFQEPFRFDITRHPNRHLGFGTGEHFCLGAHLARASIRALLEELGARLERLEYAGDASQIHSSFVVGLKTLPVRYEIKPRRS